MKCLGLSNLRVLLLEGYKINDIIILCLGTHIGLKKLEKLYPSENSFNSDIFSSLKDLPSLTHLDLSYNEIDEKIEMSDIVALSNLKFLNLQNNKFESFVTAKGSEEVALVVVEKKLVHHHFRAKPNPPQVPLSFLHKLHLSPVVLLQFQSFFFPSGSNL
ncbi:cuscuta receptor 1-like [Nicotiana tabacum]|uniref:Cuscuta receptor 1-like n=1 Tax=Nicotiana tabacum TaxID=4097 RepID=A0AC58UJC2_TOBAC